MTLLPILDQNHKGSVLKIAKVPLQISFKHSKPFLAFLVNFWPKIYLNDNLFSRATDATLGGTFSKRNHWTFQENKKQESIIWDKMGCINGCMVKSNLAIFLVPYEYLSLLQTSQTSWQFWAHSFVVNHFFDIHEPLYF